ncbi:hypothetical protein BHE74_00013907 [Ensete ventricosum]|nr:hypothetical protein GW17_00019767 [Ensete ventricosum]RWW77898.1 hypothetical protein BHE74_00013907 [Ensete ventricosum]RZR76071.1 hypothetical protein BHM03_00000676 [Ensete ventricosum]
MTDLPPCDLDALLEARWSTLKQGTQIWAGSGPEDIATIELRASEAQALADHLKVKLEEVARHREPLELDLDNSRLLLANSQE